MLVVVADTGPPRYLLQIGHVELCPDCSRRYSSPQSSRMNTEVLVVDATDDPSLQKLDEGEKSAIALGLSLSADLILIDDRSGAAVAREKGFEITGTLGILDLAADRGMISMADEIARLRNTNFRRREKLFNALLKKHEQREPGARSGPA